MSNKQENNEYDVIIIGSGIGGLAAASLLSRFYGRKVLILERHWTVGGFTHMFRRKRKFAWDVGVHYIGDLAPGSMMEGLFETISGPDLKWNKMPDVFEKFVYPDLTLEVPSSLDGFMANLLELFPDEESALRDYFSDMRQISAWFGRQVGIKARAPFVEEKINLCKLKGGGPRGPLETTGAYLKRNFRSEKLIGLLASQWGDYGLPPARSSLLIHAMIVNHYLQGGYYPVGGAQKIADGALPLIEKAGGKLLLKYHVEEILVEEGKVAGVRARYTRGRDEPVEKEFRAPVVISNAGALNTYLKLVPEEYPIRFRDDLKNFAARHPTAANITLYLGFNQNPAKMGFHGENHWIYSSYDHDQNFERRKEWFTTGYVPGAYLSFPSLKDPDAEAHTGEIIAFSDYEHFAPWREQAWRKRDDEYKQLKDRLSRSLLDYIEKRYPGFGDMVDFSEVSTPLSTEYFTDHPRGSIYGLACVPERFDGSKAPWHNPTSPLPGLYLAGADASSPGVAGALMGGIAAVCQVLGGINMIRLMKETRG